MGDKPQSTAPSAIQVKNWQQTVRIEEKLDIIGQLEKGELIVNICLNVRFTRSVHTVRDDADRNANSVNLCCLCSKTTTSPIKMNCTKYNGCESLHFYCIRSK